jgi:hypothetical protein
MEMIVVIYVLLGILSYFKFKKILNPSKFDLVWYSVFWPATWIIVIIGKIKDTLE